MDNAQLISLSRQVALQRQMDVVANNMANLNTTGFKAINILFNDVTMPRAERGAVFSPADPAPAFTEDWATMHDLSPGAFTDTGNTLDVALDGPGFLAVETAEGERYTKAGALQIDSTGTLVDLNGRPVLSTLGQIHFEPGETDITITADGTILTADGSKGQLKIAEFENPQALTREGDNLFAGSNPLAGAETRVVQGAIERSNVSGVAEMTEMIRVTRAYQSITNIMQQQDEMRRSAIERLGSLRS